MIHCSTARRDGRARPKRAALAGLMLVVLAGCTPPATTSTTQVTPGGKPVNVDFVPDFARKPYEAFSRTEAVAIAQREWRLFGQPVDDDPPDTRPPPPPELKPEREPGLWERVGEYWWLGMNSDQPDRAWTGKHDSFGVVFPASDDGEYAWSAAFISYVMRIAGAGERFPYSPTHATYVDAAWHVANGGGAGWVVSAERPDAYPPQLGSRIRYQNLPASFSGHCDIVVQIDPGVLSVVGGNVDDAVTMKHIPVNAGGMLADPGGQAIDTRYPWFVVVRILYDAP
jgi:hypothetical protein